MATRKRSSFKNVSVTFKNSIILDVNKLMAMAEVEIPKLIRKRVKKDRDIWDQPFQGLAPSTIERLRDEGKRERPILRGPMVEDIVATKKRKEGKGAVLTFEAYGSDERGRLWSAIGWFHQTGKGVVRRAWFGLSKKDRRSLTRILKKADVIKSDPKPARKRRP